MPGDPANPAVSPTVELTVVQLQHASTINAVGLARAIPERGRIIAVATAYQESSLRNRPNGDRDSVGLFQQRPSQGWGTVEQIMDPVYASGKFYDALLEVQDWQDMPLTEAAQAVQYSGFPDAYAKWEPQATTLVRGLSGGEELTLNCAAGARQPTSEIPARPAPAGSDNATPELTAALAAAQAELGGLTIDGRSPPTACRRPSRRPSPSWIRRRPAGRWPRGRSRTRPSMLVTDVAVQDRRMGRPRMAVQRQRRQIPPRSRSPSPSSDAAALGTGRPSASASLTISAPGEHRSVQVHRSTRQPASPPQLVTGEQRAGSARHARRTRPAPAARGTRRRQRPAS